MKDWLYSLEQRERIFVVGGAIAVVIALLYAFLWVPLDQGHRTLQSSVDAWQRSLAEIRPLRGSQAAQTTPTLPAVNTQQTHLSRKKSRRSM